MKPETIRRRAEQARREFIERRAKFEDNFRRACEEYGLVEAIMPPPPSLHAWLYLEDGVSEVCITVNGYVLC